LTARVRTRIVLLAAGLAALLVAVPAAAQTPGGGTAPAYPGNTLMLSRQGRAVAGTTIKVRLSGHADWGQPTDDTTTPYSLSLYVQNADVDGRCEPSKGAQRQKAINIATLGASETITDFVLDDNFFVNPAPPNPTVDWSIDSLPFVITPGVSHVLLCGYVSFIIDDVAWYQLPVKVDQPACSIARSVVRRGRKLAVDCNFTGPLTVRFRGAGRTRKATLQLDGAGRGKVSTASLRPGSYRVALSSGTLAVRVAKHGTVRVR
jgi:hypothetical protein